MIRCLLFRSIPTPRHYRLLYDPSNGAHTLFSRIPPPRDRKQARPTLTDSSPTIVIRTVFTNLSAFRSIIWVKSGSLRHREEQEVDNLLLPLPRPIRRLSMHLKSCPANHFHPPRPQNPTPSPPIPNPPSNAPPSVPLPPRSAPSEDTNNSHPTH